MATRNNDQAFFDYCRRKGITSEQYREEILPVWEAAWKAAFASESAPTAPSVTPEQELLLAKAKALFPLCTSSNEWEEFECSVAAIDVEGGPVEGEVYRIACSASTAEEARARRDAVLAALAFASESATKKGNPA